MFCLVADQNAIDNLEQQENDVSPVPLTSQNSAVIWSGELCFQLHWKHDAKKLFWFRLILMFWSIDKYAELFCRRKCQDYALYPRHSSWDFINEHL